MDKIQRLQTRKKELRLTFDELAKLSGIPKKTLSNIFRGITTNPRIDTVQAIERALGLTPAFTEEERAMGISENHAVVLSDDDRELINLYAEAEEVLGVEKTNAYKQILRIMIEQERRK